MKFSALLPTRNRLEYLRNAVETVRRQDYDNWEIIVSDNFSEDDIRGYVASLGDDRIKYFRTEEFLPVTKNWNNALEKSSGDYVVMLGDDDGLMPDYFSKSKRLIEQFESPDVVYTGAYNYGYPNATKEHPEGYLHTYSYADFFQGITEPFLLDPAEARRVAMAAMDFRIKYGFNMQFALIRRAFFESLADKGPLFQSPFPDYYAMNVMFLKAKRILAVPEPMVIIGVSPKSYGSFLNKNVESEGIQFLEGVKQVEGYDHLKDVVLPGTNINTSWLYSLDTIKANYGKEFAFPDSHERYRMLQAVTVHQKYYVEQVIPKAEFEAFQSRLKPWERIVFGGTFRAVWAAARLASGTAPGRAVFRRVFRQEPHKQWLMGRMIQILDQFPRYRAVYSDGKFPSIVDVYEAFDRAPSSELNPS